MDNKNRGFEKIDMSDTAKLQELAEQKQEKEKLEQPKPQAKKVNVNTEIANRQAAMEAIKMKQGKMDNSSLQEDESAKIVPITKKQKWDNFWYHYKTAFWIILFASIIGVWFIKDLIFKPKYDVNLLMSTSMPLSQEMEKIKNGIDLYVSDFDENGEASTSVEIIQFGDTSNEDSMASTMDPQMIMANQTKLMASLTGFSYVLMALDDFNYEYLTESEVKFLDLSTISDNPNIKGDRFYINGSEFQKTILNGYETLTEDLSLSIVDVKYLGEKYTKDEKFMKKYNEALEVITNIIEETPVTEKTPTTDETTVE